MAKFKLGIMIGFLAGWAVGSGRAARMIKQLKASRDGEVPGAVASRVPRPAFDRSSPSAAVSA
jgi:hypothetical protein